ncbi:hypothetical protein Tsubulata_009997 [Turnera subulata]|uniref:Glycosyltransferase n=1 Tax=Turnera subulata TaxID=218843 RepID=A0A9Q0JJD3_9ROSI|nr:hypothetical protein Tsubulata_009997 [Turnera subulata]
MASPLRQLHFILFPFMAPGHMIPLMDIGKLLAREGMMVSIVTTPINAKRFATIVAQAVESGLQMQFIELAFPSEEVGLPSKCENMDMMPSLGSGNKFLKATYMLQEPAQRLLQQLNPKPSCIISDQNLPYTSEIAKVLHIPRISFDVNSPFCLLCWHNLYVNKVLERVTSVTEPFLVPGIPDRVAFTKSQLPDAMADTELDFFEKVVAAEKTNFGLVINTFEGLEAAYVQGLRESRGYKVWCVGPVSLCNRDNLEKVHRGDKPTIDESECLEWLNSQQPGSVVYACFGTLCNLTTPQLIELGMGLEASNRPFIWAIRSGETSKGLQEWIAEDGFEERTKRRGLVIRGWAPQIIILSHAAIGGFLTHCGWNSTLEAIWLACLWLHGRSLGITSLMRSWLWMF